MQQMAMVGGPGRCRVVLVVVCDILRGPVSVMLGMRDVVAFPEMRGWP